MNTNATPLTPLDATPMAPPKDELDTALDRLVDKATAGTREAIAAAEQALAQRDELAACLREVLKGFETGVFVRNIEGDGQPDWAIKLIPFVALLGRCQAALARIPDQKEKA